MLRRMSTAKKQNITLTLKLETEDHSEFAETWENNGMRDCEEGQLIADSQMDLVDVVQSLSVKVAMGTDVYYQR